MGLFGRGDLKRICSGLLHVMELLDADLALFVDAFLGFLLLEVLFFSHGRSPFAHLEISTTSYLIVPTGASTSTMSPTAWPMSALATGDSSLVR